ncbi:MAG: 6-phosphogluconolactonase [Acidobacteriia bacterium]|nr:6-phosphogluconolactonase [Terriglobia bacterium]
MTSAPRTAYPSELLVYGDAEQLASAAAELFVKVATESISARGRFRVALSGGSTPRRVYELLATNEFSSRVDWDHADIFWGDERYVPANDRDSNYRMTYEALLRHVPLPSANIHRVPTEISPPRAAAGAYEEDIRQSLRDSVSVPQFDLVYLGLGTNGHTASLFPHSPALQETSRLVLADFVAEVSSWRISLSAPLLNRGRTVAFLVAGQEKAQVLREVLLGPRDPERLPAQLIVPEGKLLWLVDDAAAALVSDTGRQRRRA